MFISPFSVSSANYPRQQAVHFGARRTQKNREPLAIKPDLDSIPEEKNAIKLFGDDNSYDFPRPKKIDPQQSTVTFSTSNDHVKPTLKTRSRLSSGTLTKPPANLPKPRKDEFI